MGTLVKTESEKPLPREFQSFCKMEGAKIERISALRILEHSKNDKAYQSGTSLSCSLICLHYQS